MAGKRRLMPIRRMSCHKCLADLSYESFKEHFTSGGTVPCPYLELPYPDLRAGHDQIYFGRWRRLDATPLDIQRAHRQIDRHLRAIGQVVAATDLPAARRDLDKALEALHVGDPRGESPDALRFLDHALSYAHRALDDLLHEKGLPPHLPMDYAEWYDAAEVPFREEL
jgi:hypothetical protein